MSKRTPAFGTRRVCLISQAKLLQPWDGALSYDFDFNLKVVINVTAPEQPPPSCPPTKALFKVSLCLWL